MRQWLKSLYGRYSRLVLLPLVLIGLTSLAGCSGNFPLSLLSGGGPNVAANTQLGQENNQTIGQTNSRDLSIVRPQARDITQSSDDNRVKADRVNTVVVNEYPVWLILAFVVAVLLDSPLRWFQEIFSRKKE